MMHDTNRQPSYYSWQPGLAGVIVPILTSSFLRSADTPVAQRVIVPIFRRAPLTCHH
jgi:hypothetical protein